MASICEKETYSYPYYYFFNQIRIYHECESGIEKCVSRITDSHLKACRVMSNGDNEGRILLSHPQTNSGLFFLLTIKYLILY